MNKIMKKTISKLDNSTQQRSTPPTQQYSGLACVFFFILKQCFFAVRLRRKRETSFRFRHICGNIKMKSSIFYYKKKYYYYILNFKKRCGANTVLNQIPVNQTQYRWNHNSTPLGPIFNDVWFSRIEKKKTIKKRNIVINNYWFLVNMLNYRIGFFIQTIKNNI